MGNKQVTKDQSPINKKEIIDFLRDNKNENQVLKKLKNDLEKFKDYERILYGHETDQQITDRAKDTIGVLLGLTDLTPSQKTSVLTNLFS